MEERAEDRMGEKEKKKGRDSGQSLDQTHNHNGSLIKRISSSSACYDMSNLLNILRHDRIKMDAMHF